MVEHLVLFEVKPETPAPQIEAMLTALASLKDKVPGIRELSCGANFSDRGGVFTHALRVQFPSRSELQAYLPHPEHQATVKEHVLPIVGSILVADYEV